MKKMMCGKISGPSATVAEMLKASDDVGKELVTGLATSTVFECVVPSDWECSYIINCYKGTTGDGNF